MDKGDEGDKIEKLSKKQIDEVKGGLLSQYRRLQTTGTKGNNARF